MQRTVVSWEGVTNYLTVATVDTTLRYLSLNLGAGGRIILAYLDRAAWERFDGFDEWHASAIAAGEPWTFGFRLDELPAYPAARGMRCDLSTHDAAGRYLEPLNPIEPAAACYRIAEAEVG